MASRVPSALAAERRPAKEPKSGAGTYKACRPSWPGALCRPSAEERRRGPPHWGERKICCLLCRHRERWVFSLPMGPGTLHFPVGLKLESLLRAISLALSVPPPGCHSVIGESQRMQVEWLVGLGVWFLLRVRQILRSSSARALLFPQLCVSAPLNATHCGLENFTEDQ